MKVLAQLFGALAILLSAAMCAITAYHYCELQWGGKYAGYSAPPSAALYLTIPFLIGIIACVALAILCWKKGTRKE